MDERTLRPRSVIREQDIVKIKKTPVSRRELLRLGLFGTASAAAVLAGIDALAWAPQRVALAATAFPDIQFDIDRFINPAQTINGVPVQCGPVYTFLLPARLNRSPSKADQAVFAHALNTIEANYSFSPSGVFTLVAYGLPYFKRLPASLVASHMPLRNDGSKRPVLEEAVPSPTDVSPLNPGISKLPFHVPVRIEANDVLFTFRSDILSNITNVVSWLQGSHSLACKPVPSPAFNGLFTYDVPRINFVQQGLPRALANQHHFPYASEIDPGSTMWMGFVDQQAGGSAPAGTTVTFAGSSAGVLTTARAGDYFDNGSIQHLSHVIDDLAQYYNNTTNPEPWGEPVQDRFRSKMKDERPGLPSFEDPDAAFPDGGGQNTPEGNRFNGPGDIATNFDPDGLARQINLYKKYRVGHWSGSQCSVHAANGTELHICMDGPGLSSLDVPGGSTQPTLECTVFVPTAEFFRIMRVNSASLDYSQVGDQGDSATSVPPESEAADANDAGLERFLTVTRRQNFLIPPRRSRAFPLLELT